jgi:hypothetical protein
MGLLDKILGRDEKSQLVINAGQTWKMVSGYTPVFHDWHGEIYESMLVRASIDARARHASKLKAEIVGSAKPDLSARLKKRPNPWDTWSQFLYRVSTILDCCNNCLLVPIFDDDLNKIGFYPVLPTSCNIVEYKGELWLKYKYLEGRKTAACKINECAILRKFQFKSDFFGSSNDALTPTMDLIAINDQGIKEAIKSTAGYQFMARLANFTKKEDLVKEREEFSEAAFGKEAKNRNGVLLFPNTYQDVKQIEMKPWTPDEDQINQIRENVFSYFGVNDAVLQNKTSGDAWSAFYEGAVEPFSIQLSETLTAALYSEREIAHGASIMFTANRLQYMNFADKLNFVTGLGDRGLLMIDEAREVFNLPTLPDDQGQRFIARGEYYFIQEENPKEEEEGNASEE